MIDKDQQQEESSIEEERAMYQGLLDQSSAMITVIDAETFRIRYANAAACEVTKNLTDGYVGSVCYKSIAHRDEPCPNCILIRDDAPEQEIKEIPFGNRIYQMRYKQIEWNSKRALMEYSEDITEQKQVVKLAEEKEQLQSNIIQNLPTGIIVYKIENHNYKLVQANPAVCRMMGFSEEDVDGSIGERILTLVVPEDKETVRRAAIQMATPGVDVHYEFRTAIRGTDDIIWVAAEGRSALQADGSVYVYIAYKDITADKQKEYEFQQQVDFIANLEDVRIISKGRHNLTQNRVLNLSSQKRGAITGEKGETYDSLLPKLVATACSDMKQDELRQALDRKKLIADFTTGRKELSIDYRRNMADSKTIWATLKCSLYEEPGTHDVIASLYSYDSTEQIQESQIVTRLSTLEYLLLGLIDIDSHRYKTVTMAGVSPDRYKDLQGDYDELIVNRCNMPAIRTDRAKLYKQMCMDTILDELKTRRVYEVDYSVAHEDRTESRMRFRYSYLDETRDTIIFFSSDITENYEREQRQLHKVEQALQRAQEASRSKSAFFSRMSHDMRTPMNGILGMTSLSETEQDAGVLKENMKKIQESGQYLLSLINDTLDVQRIESGKMKLEPKVISTTEVVENILDMVRASAEAKGVTLKFDPGNADLNWYVRVDPVRIKQIFINLLSNAVKFTPKGGTVEFVSRLVAREGMISHNIFTIRDTGIGMTRKFLQNGIFRPFSQENNQITANYAGSGLGLSIVKSLVEMMDGSIEVESRQGVGTTFTIHLDLERVDPAEVVRMQKKQEIKKNIRAAALEGKNILLTEDHPLNAEIAQKLLEKAGCRVTWAKNGAECIEMLKQSKSGQYDIILMDIRMPVMDGLEAARCIRQLERDDLRQIPIIAMTANAYSDDVQNCLKAGMNAHLAKPVEAAQMYETIMEYL